MLLEVRNSAWPHQQWCLGCDDHQWNCKHNLDNYIELFNQDFHNELLFSQVF